MAKAFFPTIVWNGTSQSRQNAGDFRKPDEYDWAQIIAEVIAVEQIVNQIDGSPGPTGPQGHQGPQGIQGPQGVQGNTGPSRHCWPQWS